MCYWILAKNTQELVRRSTVVPISEYELRDPTLIKGLAEFDTDIEIILGKFDPGTAIGDSPEGTIANTFTQDDDEGEEVHHPLEPDATAFEIGEIGEDLYDHYIASEVILPQGENHITAKVIARKRDADGALVGKRNNNLILDTCVCEVQFPDGHTEEYAANIIAESLYLTIDDEWHTYLIMKDVVGHKSTHQLSNYLYTCLHDFQRQHFSFSEEA
jgi:hypothetical protein